MKNVLITGINGSMASYFAEYLLQYDDLKIFGIARNTNRNHDTRIEFIFCDLNDLSSTLRALEKSEPDYIFHIASNANVRMSFEQPIAFLNNNINSTINLLEAIRILNIKPLLQFCGTSEVYGQVSAKDIPIKETQTIDPINVYAISKLTQEKLVQSYWLSYGIPFITTRAFGYINPRRSDIFSSSFAKQIVEIEQKKKDVLYHGNLESIRTLLDVRDICEAYWVASQKCRIGEAYNIGSIVPVSVRDFLDLLKKYSTVEIISKNHENLTRPVDVTLQIPDVSKFEKETNWKPKYSLDDSVQFLLDHYRNELK